MSKLFIVWAKRVQRSYLSWHWGMIQTLERNRLVVSKLHEQFDKFWPEHLKVSKTFLLGVMAMKNDAKFEEELTCYFKIYNREFDKFWPKHLKFSNIFTLMSSFWARYILFELKKYRGVFSWHWRVMQSLKKKLRMVWKMTWGIWQIFTRALESFKIGTLMGSFCPM